MTRVLIAECKQEVSTFNPALSRFEDFDISSGDDLLAFHRNTPSEVGGAFRALANAGVEAIGAYSARAITSSGTVAAADWTRLAAEFVAELRQTPPVDGVFFAMHGAMCAENEIDP